MPSSNEDLVFGFDVGTTAVKGGVFTLDGEQIFSESIACPNHYPRAGWVEQDPEVWIDCITEIIHSASTQIDIKAVKAMGICSQVNTHVFVNANGEPLDKAIIWQDQRCADTANMLVARAAENNLAVSIDSSSLLSRAEWFAKSRPDYWQQTRSILSPKDYCVLRLTGEVVSDPLSSIGLVNVQGHYNSSVVALVDGLAERLPVLKTISDVIGACNHSAVPLNCPVVVGTMDAWASLYGSGHSEAGDGFQVAGTSEIIGLLSGEHHITPGVVTFPPANGLYLHAGPTQAGGDALTWFAQAMDKGIEEILSAAESAVKQDEPLIFLPYLMGERAPLWDATARATFCGLSKRHSQADMALAVLEGVGFSARHLLEEIEKAAGFGCNALRLSGGGSRSDFWCQVKANTMNRTLERVKNIDTGTFGAALMAMVGTGVYADVNAAAGSAVAVDRTFEPEQALTDWYKELYGIYRDAYNSLTPVFSKLSTLQSHRLN